MIIDEERIESILLSELENISKEDFDRLCNLFYYPYLKKYYRIFNGKIKHMKPYYILSDYLVNELIGSLISEYFGDERVEKKVVKTYNRGIFHLLSDNFVEDGFRYCNLNDERFSSLNLKNHNNSVLLLDRIDTLDFNKEDLKLLKQGLKRMIVSDFISRVQDRAYRNFMVRYHKDKINLLPLYDYEFSFLESDELYQNVFMFDNSNFDEMEYIRNDEDFQKYLYMAMDLDMKKIIEELHDKYPIILDEEEKNNYSSVVLKQQNKIKQFRLIK